MTYRQAAELPRPIVLVNGTFDLLHPSHVKRLAVGARYRSWFPIRDDPDPPHGSGSLIVSLDTDRRVERLKGWPPVLSLCDRTAIIAPYPYVDAVVWHSDDLALKVVVEYLQPDIWIARDDVPEVERLTARMAGTLVIRLPRQGPHSSTHLRDRLLTR